MASEDQQGVVAMGVHSVLEIDTDENEMEDYFDYRHPQSMVGATAARTSTSLTTPIKDRIDNSRMMVLSANHRQALRALTPKTPPSELTRLQESATKRRRTVQCNMHDLERRIARLSINLSHESFEREKWSARAMKTTMFEPLELLVKQVSYEREYASLLSQNALVLDQQASPTTKKGSSWMILERRLARLDTEMTNYTHLTIPSLLHDQLDRPTDELITLDTPKHHQEASHDALQRFSKLCGEYETIAGLITRRHEEERSARKAACEIIQKQFLVHLNETDNDEDLLKQMEGDQAEFLKHLQALRRQVEEERIARMERDEEILAIIVNKVTTMRRAFLESVGQDVPKPESLTN